MAGSTFGEAVVPRLLLFCHTVVTQTKGLCETPALGQGVRWFLSIPSQIVFWAGKNNESYFCQSISVISFTFPHLFSQPSFPLRSHI